MLKYVIEKVFEAIIFLFVIVIIFNTLVEFLQTLGMFQPVDVKIIGLISVFLALNNMFTKKFFGFDLFNNNKA